MRAGFAHDLIQHPRIVPAAIAAFSLSALAIAYASQVWGGLQPCILCIYQRYAYGVALGFGLLGLGFGGHVAARRVLVVLGGLAFLGVAAIAAFHVGVERHWWQGTAACHAPVMDPNASLEDLRKQLLATPFVACDQVPWSLFGISIAGYNFLISLALALGCLWAAKRIEVGRGT